MIRYNKALIIGFNMNLTNQEFFDLVSDENKKTLLISFAKKNLDVAKEYLDYIKSHYSKIELVKIFNEFLTTETIPEDNFNILLPLIKEEVKQSLFKSNERSILSEKSIQYFQKKEGIDFVIEVAPYLQSKKMLKKFLDATHDQFVYETDYFTIKDENYETFKHILVSSEDNKLIIEGNVSLDYIAKSNYAIELLKEFNQKHILDNVMNNYYNLEALLFNLMKNPFVLTSDFEIFCHEVKEKYQDIFEDKMEEDDASEISIYFVSNTIPKNEFEREKFNVMFKEFKMVSSVSSLEDLIEMKIENISNMLKILQLTKQTDLYTISDMVYNTYELNSEGFLKQENMPLLFELVKFSKTTVKDEEKLLKRFFMQFKNELNEQYKKGNIEKIEFEQFSINFENQLFNETIKEESLISKKYKI